MLEICNLCQLLTWGVGGGGIFVPMLILVIGFDPKSATAISKCMITGAAISTVFFNLKLKHPTLDIPIIDYDLVLLNQPLQMLGISIGVVLSVIFADWMVTILLIIIFIGTSMKAFFKGVETWKKETKMKEETVKLLESIATCSGEEEYKCLPDCQDGGPKIETRKPEGTILNNIRWKEFGLLSFVWIAFLLLQIAKIPVSLGVSLYQAVGLYQGWRIIASKGGGFVMGPLFLELGIAPQVASATATFGMTFSASISVVQYYLLNRFPVPYALYLTFVAAVAAYIGQQIIDKLINIFQRASLIIFVLAFTYLSVQLH
ncbi:Transmembrane protein [Sesbania bispinosa]|nr:Transmembrane protein [Sesbania bispinosa]